MKTDYIVTNLPIKPLEKASIGRITAALIGEFVSKKIDCNYTLSLNTLNSYEDKSQYVDTYLNSIQDIGIHYDYSYVDSEHINKYLEIIEELMFKGIIVKKNKPVLRCECGKVDIIKDGIRSYNGASLYEIVGENYVCKECGGICKEYNEEGLFFKFDIETSDEMKLFPSYLKKNILQFSEQIKGQELLISKQRQTGCTIGKFNIDVDFLWMLYVNSFSEKNIIMVACNREIFKMYLLNYINKHINDKNLMFIAHPFINKPNNMDLKGLMARYDELYRKLSILYTIKWHNKECLYSLDIINQISKLGGEKRKILYDAISIPDYVEDNDIEKYFENLFFRQINIQKDVNKVRKLVI